MSKDVKTVQIAKDEQEKATKLLQDSGYAVFRVDNLEDGQIELHAERVSMPEIPGVEFTN